MKEIKLLKDMEKGRLYDEELGSYKITKNGLDDIVIIRNLKYRKLSCPEVSVQGGKSSYSVVEVENCDTYIVKPFDTLITISNNFNIDINEIKKKNNLKCDKLFIGQVIKI